MRVLIIDNYDSFTFNLYQYVGEILQRRQELDGFEVIVKRNDEVTLDEVNALDPDRIIISPGPGTPEDREYFGVCQHVITHCGKTTPLLGVCLGMQGIAYCFGAHIVRASVPMHGKVSGVAHDNQGVFSDMPQNLEIMRYHSLIVDATTLPDCLEITSVISENGNTHSDFTAAVANGREIMGIRHKEYPIEGIQFHPESFATEGGQALLQNFLFPPN